jgi:dehydrogenase/reductase SDR family protein 12
LNEKKLTSEGKEATIASHLIGGSYLLSNLLMPQLRAAGTEARVIFVTSGGMYLTKFPSWETATSKTDLKYDGVMAYSYAKRGQVLLAERLAKLNPEITWITVHPGWTATAAVDDAFGKDKVYLEPMRTVWQGAEGIAWAATTAKENLENGNLYLDRVKQKKHLPLIFTNTKNTETEVDELMSNLSNEAQFLLRADSYAL